QVIGAATALTLGAGVLSYLTDVRPPSQGELRIDPNGAHEGWFSALERRSSRATASAEITRTFASGDSRHDVKLLATLESRRLDGRVAERPLLVEDEAGQAVRRIDFGPPAALRARDTSGAVALQDRWTASDRTTLEGGVRVDFGTLGGGLATGRI